MIKAGQHVFDCLAGEDVGSMHWSMHCFAPVCCSFLPCRLNAFSFSSFSFHSFCNFFTPAFQASSRKKEPLQCCILLSMQAWYPGPVREMRCILGGVPSGGWGTRHTSGNSYLLI